MDDARSEVNGKCEKIAPPRQNIFDISENSCWYLPQKKMNQLQPKITSQISHVEQSCRFTIPANASKLQGRDSCYYKYPGDGNQIPRRRWQSVPKREPQEQEIDEDDPCYYKYPGDGNQAQSQDGDGNQSQDEIKSWEPQEQEIDEDDPCYYKYPGDGNVLNPTQEKNEFHDEMSPENNQNDKKRSVRHSCFYKRNG